MQLTLGSAPDSWGVWFADDPRQIPWRRFLDEVAQAGYAWIELGPYGYLPADLPVLRAELAARGLRVTGSFIDGALHRPAEWPALERRALAMGALLAGLDATYLVAMTTVYADPFTGRPLGPRQLTGDDWRRLIDTTHRLADLARDRFGLRLVFHPHAGMYVETEAEIEALLADTDPARVALCLDTGQHAVAGGDPLAFLRRHHRRIPYLHLKNVDAAVLRRVRAEALPVNAAVPLGLYCEPDRGVIDFAALIDLLAEIDFQGWGIVEQDLYPVDFDRPLPIARRSRAYLLSLLEQAGAGAAHQG
jgi:inosose dehydratase